jgi:hypothetical protein
MISIWITTQTKDILNTDGPWFESRFWGHCLLIFNAYWGSFPGVERAGREIDQSRASSAEVNECSNTSVFLVCLYGVDRDNFVHF